MKEYIVGLFKLLGHLLLTCIIGASMMGLCQLVSIYTSISIGTCIIILIVIVILLIPLLERIR